MKYLFFSIPTNVVPEKVYHIEELNLIILASDRNETRTPTIQTKSKLGLIYYMKDGDFQSEYVRHELKKFCGFLGFFQHGNLMSHWLLSLPFGYFNNISSFAFETSRDILSLAKSFHANRKNTLIYDFNSFPLPYLNKGEVDFVDLYRAYRDSSTPKSLIEKIELFSFATQTNLLISIYDNANLEISLLFSILEKIIKQTVSEKRIKVPCNEKGCSKTIERNKGMGALITEYVNQLDTTDKDKVFLKKLLKSFSGIRNVFYHGLDALPHKQSFNLAMDRLGVKELNIEQDLEFGEGRALGVLNIRMLLFMEILNNLEGERIKKNTKT